MISFISGVLHFVAVLRKELFWEGGRQLPASLQEKSLPKNSDKMKYTLLYS